MPCAFPVAVAEIGEVAHFDAPPTDAQSLLWQDGFGHFFGHSTRGCHWWLQTLHSYIGSGFGFFAMRGYY
jgi:hypothetical protein